MTVHEADRQDDGVRMAKKTRLLTLILASALASTSLSLVLSVTSALGHAGYLINGGFEDGTSHWKLYSGATFVTVTEPVRSGTWAASLTMSDSTAEIWIYQDVPVFPGATYTLTGWIYKDEHDFEYADLRLKWDSNSREYNASLGADSDFYRPVTVGPLVAPPDATKARIRAVAKIRSPNPPNPIYFDDISLTCSLTPRLFLPLQLKDYAR
jgi:hypothetical protein